MTLRTKVGSVLIGFALAPIGALANTILVNGGFETGTTAGWYTSGDGSVSSNESHSGNYSFAANSNGYLEQHFDAVPVQHIAQLSFWGKRDQWLFDSLKFYYADGTTEVNVVLKPSTGNWTFVDLQSFLNSNKALTGVGIYGTSPGPVYLDDFELRLGVEHPVPEPTTAMLMSLGLIALIRRREQKR